MLSKKKGFTLLEVVIVIFLLSILFVGLGKGLSVLSEINIKATMETKSRSDSYKAISTISNSVNSLISNDRLATESVPAGLVIEDYIEIIEDTSDSAIKYIKATEMTLNMSDHVKSRTIKIEALEDFEQRDPEKMIDGRILIENIKYQDASDTRVVPVLESPVAVMSASEPSKNSYFLIAMEDDQLKYLRTNLLYPRGKFSVQVLDVILTCPQEVTVALREDL